MPYSVGKHDSCPASKPHAVLRADGSVVPGGCHESRADALSHQRALMVNVPDAKKTSQGLQAALDRHAERA